MTPTTATTKNLENSTALAAHAVTNLDGSEKETAFLKGFHAWVSLEPMPTGYPVEALGWLAASRLNERGGDRPKRSDAAHTLTVARAALAAKAKAVEMFAKARKMRKTANDLQTDFPGTMEGTVFSIQTGAQEIHHKAQEVLDNAKTLARLAGLSLDPVRDPYPNL